MVDGAFAASVPKGVSVRGTARPYTYGITASAFEPTPPELIPPVPEPDAERLARRAAPPNDRAMTVIRANVGVFERIGRLWRYRELLGGLVRKELKVKYKNSVLGFAWSLLNPLLVLLVYWVAFGVILGTSIPRFPIFLLAGVLVWNFFSMGALSACTSVVQNSALVKKVSFPREVLPLASVGAALVHFVLQGIVLAVALFFFGHGIAWGYIGLLPIAIVVMVLLTAALGVLLAAVNVHLRDMQHFLELALIAWFWMTPIVYGYGFAAPKLHRAKVLYISNPLLGVVLAFQRVIYNQLDATNVKPTYHILPHWDFTKYAAMLGIEFVGSLVLLYVAFYVFGRLEGSIAEEL
jgi:ABC-2 type transport system permease protein